MELLRCRRESVENVRKSANVTSMVSCRIFPSRPRKTPWKIPHGNLRRFTGHHCEFQSYRTLYQTTRGGFWSVVFFLIFENHHIFEPGSWEPSKHMYQGGRSEFLLVELWPSVSVHETHSIIGCSPHLAGMPRQLARLPNMLGYTAYDRQLRSQVQLCESPVGSMTPAPA